MNKKRIYYLLLFVLFLFVFDRFFFFSFSKLEKHTYRHQNFKKRFITFPSGTYDTLIVGSSRTNKGIHPALLYKSLGIKAKKIARATTGFKFNYKFYLEYKKFLNKPKFLIYGLDYFMFKMHSNQKWMRFFSETKNKDLKGKGILRLFSNKKGIDSLIVDSLNDMNAFLLPKQKTTNKPLEKFIHIKRKGKLVKVKRIPDYMSKFVGFKSKDSFKPSKVANFDKVKYFKFPGREGQYFTKLLEELHKDKVTVILVFLPDIIGTYETAFQRELFIDNIRALSKKYPNVFIYNYNDPKIFPLDKKEYFLDGGYGFINSHLSMKGSKLLNRLLCKDIRLLIKKKLNNNSRNLQKGINP